MTSLAATITMRYERGMKMKIELDTGNVTCDVREMKVSSFIACAQPGLYFDAGNGTYLHLRADVDKLREIVSVCQTWLDKHPYDCETYGKRKGI